MADTIDVLQKKFERLLKNIKGSPTSEFTKITEVAFEAVICARTINEYATLYGSPLSIKNPNKFLNQKPGKFHPSKSFKVQFPDVTFYFAMDVECYGLPALLHGKRCGDKFEADVVVIDEKYEIEILSIYGGYPTPEYLNAAYECKFGAYEKSQLRELMGLRRHLSLLRGPISSRHPKGFPFGERIHNSDPDIQILLFRPTSLPFLELQTGDFYDLHQIVIV